MDKKSNSDNNNNKNPMSPMSETPQPNSIKNSDDILSPSLNSNKENDDDIISVDINSPPKKRQSKLREYKTGRTSLPIRDDGIPTSPIPQYKHITILTDHDKVDQNIITNKSDNDDDDDDEYDEEDGNNTNVNHRNSKSNNNMINKNNNNNINNNNIIGQLAILANQLDFIKLVNKMTWIEHVLLIIGVLLTWILIVSYITLEFSTRKRPREVQLFLFASATSILYFLILNPFYFAKFSNKFVPLTSQQLFEKTQPIPTSNSNIGLRINDESENNHNQLKYHKGSDDSDDDESENGENNSSSSLRSKPYIYHSLKWFLRIIALFGSLFLSYFIYLDLSKEIYSEYTRYYIVLLTLCLFIGNFPLMGHFMLYFRRIFLIYYLIGWIIVFGAEFAYFHFVRHVEEKHFAAFILINCIFFLFHWITTTWSSFAIKHRTLFEIDPNLFPNSNHYRVWYNNIDYQNNINNNNNNITNNNGDFGEKDDKKTDRELLSGFRTVSCCCNKLICDSHTLLRFQSYISSLSFWSFLGIMYTLGVEYIVISACIFMLVNTIWNPLFYSKEVIFIRSNLKCCCSFRKWFFYIMLIIAYIIGFVLNVSWFSFSISAYILKNDNAFQYTTIINMLIFLFTIIIFFLPSVGYSFYRIPVSYGISNIFGALFCFFIPICISFNYDLKVLDNNNNNMDKTVNKVIYYDYDNNKYLGIIICAIIFSLYLTFTGLSCVSYRLKKALYQRTKSYFNKEFPMNMIMFWSFLLSFSLLTTNSLWVFGDNFGNNSYDTISIISKIVYIITIFVQCSSLFYAIFTLKSKFDQDSSLTAYLTSLTDRVRQTCGLCCTLLLFPIIYASYLIFIILISLCLGITKLLSIRQVREFWLSFLISTKPNNFNDQHNNNNNNGHNNNNNNNNNNNIIRNLKMPNNDSMIQSVATQSEFTKTNTNEHIQIEVMALNKQISLGERNNNNKHNDIINHINSNNNNNNNYNDPSSPNTDFLDNELNFLMSQQGNEVHRRMSNSAIQSVHMKIFKCCDCLTPTWMSSLYINESVYNNYLMSELIVESLPLLMLNLVNMFFLNDRITKVSIIQASCSALFLLYSCAKTLYYIRFHEWNLAKFLPYK